MILNQANLARYASDLNVSFNRGFASVAPAHAQLASLETTVMSRVVYNWLQSFSGMRKWEGELKLTHLVAQEWTVISDPYYDAIEIPRSALREDNYGMFTKLVQRKGQSATLHPDKLLAALLLSGFTEHDYTGSPFFAENKKHAKNMPLTFTNKFDYKLTQGSFSEAKKMAAKITDPEDNPFATQKRTLVVGPNLYSTARLILNAEQVDGTSNTTADSAHLLEWDFLGNSNAWFLIAAHEAVGAFIHQESEPLEYAAQDQARDHHPFTTGNNLYKWTSSRTMAFGLPQLAFGSTGTTDIDPSLNPLLW
jgi:phage major head subunit gpT-like protein